jgi:hypothetical protein
MSIFRKRQSPSSKEIDLRDPVRSEFVFGLPLPCPACGDAGYLDSLNMRTRVMYQHCPTCFAKWETADSDLLARNS